MRFGPFLPSGSNHLCFVELPRAHWRSFPTLPAFLTKGSVFPRPNARLRLVYAVPEGKHGCISNSRQEKKRDFTYGSTTFFEGGLGVFADVSSCSSCITPWNIVVLPLWGDASIVQGATRRRVHTAGHRSLLSHSTTVVGWRRTRFTRSDSTGGRGSGSANSSRYPAWRRGAVSGPKSPRFS